MTTEAKKFNTYKITINGNVIRYNHDDAVKALINVLKKEGLPSGYASQITIEQVA